MIRQQQLRIAVLAMATITAGLMASPQGASAWTHKSIYNFCSEYRCADGSIPDGGLTAAPNGKYYGVTADGGAYGNGTAYEITFDTAKGIWKQKTIYSFCALPSCSDGANPVRRLIMDARGNLYGTASEGGAQFQGVVFELIEDTEVSPAA